MTVWIVVAYIFVYFATGYTLISLFRLFLELGEDGSGLAAFNDAVFALNNVGVDEACEFWRLIFWPIMIGLYVIFLVIGFMWHGIRGMFWQTIN